MSDPVALTDAEADTLDAILVALWQCETNRGFDHMADKATAAVECIVAARVAEAVEQAEREHDIATNGLRLSWMTAMTEERAARLALVAKIEALVTGPTADAWRDEAARGTAVLPYASNRYVRLVDDIRAALERGTR